MNRQTYKGLLYFISAVILATLCIQLYWNYKNYQTSKQQLVNDVQTSLDNAIDAYYTKLAKEDTYEIIEDGININVHAERALNMSRIKDSSLFCYDSLGATRGLITQTLPPFPPSFAMFNSSSDSLNGYVLFGGDSIQIGSSMDSVQTFFKQLKSPVETLSSKIIVSISENDLSLPKIDSLFAIELKRKEIKMDYGLSATQFFGKTTSLRPEVIEKSTLKTASDSPFFHMENGLTAHFTNVATAVLKKNLIGMSLSILLVGGVIACLLYLLRIIRQQKQLAEVKNDLISNITHEFKTPIATIGIAMEALQKFNIENDPEKNIRYAKISSEQVDKLNVMVEKLLETATLDSEELELNLETTNLVELLRKATHKESIALGEKEIKYSSTLEEIASAVDVFHFENAINNVIDNAIKYGGTKISVEIEQKDEIEITISDSGNSLTEAHKKQIFEKFYRVPKGNTHDVKGFGIGLYYTRKIVEKHNGKIELSIQPNTQFKISLPL